MSKALKELDAAKAGVSQSELEEAFKNLSSLSKDLEGANAELETALADKEKKAQALEKAKEASREASAKRDPIFLEWQFADWVVRNADPDQPLPPNGMGAPRRAARS